MIKKVILGVSGEPGSFSEQAGLRYAQRASIHPEIVFLTDMEGVLSALNAGKIDLGIFPVVNSRGGLVRMAFEAMGKYLFTMIDEVELEVCQCLLALPDIEMRQIKKIVSHPQGIAQCEGYLQKTFGDMERVPWQDTAKAARDLSEGRLDSFTAVIASENAAKIYGLRVLAKDIQDARPNVTTFIVVREKDL